MESTIKFDIPASARSFHLFSKLPPEIRHQIWEDAILEPGMHFLRLKTAARATHLPSPLITSPDDDDDDDDASQPNPMLDFDSEPLPSKLWPATLEPRYPTPQANLSNYITLNRTLARLSATCFEAAAVVQRLVNQPGGIKLSGGRIVSLASSNDVVCLEYLSADNFRSWCRMSLDIKCPELANVRHVAVPYCHGWEAANTPFRCSHCGSQHGAGINKVYPVHLYEFLARHLPNLQTFYFIDYLIVKRFSRPIAKAQDSRDSSPPPPEVLGKTDSTVSEKFDRHKQEYAIYDSPSPSKTANLFATTRDESTTAFSDAAPSSTDRQRRVPRKMFKSDGRIFCELDGDEWNVKSRVVDTLSWIQKRFILYATRSKLSRHPHPEKVKFKVMVCEWVDKQSEAPPKLKRGALASGKPLKKRLRPSSERSQEGSTPKSFATQSLSMPVTIGLQDNFGFIFGQENNSTFKFSAGSLQPRR
ncbi:uncharacterized protein GLRG_06272 [Colletotrichum graminicola M1.001]|uniref:2EXR domain-containing protein n=1 Tax=Colletotrichum graminicola (strain M1.001 / M2 / FGSC 10212) TaxID=645133 RepID=E3QJU0_COLGM|nr:uncharacterized protein GLRG_06272 [Colletotrichum graminicola M1.001]EFQ31128.1 hypothetical protein GLRG_06272 [Colletotrichum graminicola M1.001]